MFRWVSKEQGIYRYILKLLYNHNNKNNFNPQSLKQKFPSIILTGLLVLNQLPDRISTILGKM